MATIRLVTVGKPREIAVTQLIQEYQKRLGRWIGLSWEVVPEVPFRDYDRERALKKEGENILNRVGTRDWLVLLDVEGSLVDTKQLTHTMIDWQDRGLSPVFVVGGSLGASTSVKERANWRWSLSPLTFPHAFAQLLVVEQLYRAYALYHGHPYHKE